MNKDNFNLKQFLTENKLTTVSRVSEDGRQDCINDLKEKFMEQHSYINVEDDVLEDCIKKVLDMPGVKSEALILDHVKDYILSQGLADEVIDEAKEETNYNKNNELSKSIETYRDKYVPDLGKADTVGGEIIRALDRLLYRFYNDGDMVGEGYGIETCNSSYRYLMEHVPGCPGLSLYHGKEAYENYLTKVLEIVVDYLKDNPKVFEEKNTEDSRQMSAEDERDMRDWEREDEEIDDSWYDEEEDDEEYR